MWQVYLDMNHYAAALAHCRNPYQRDQVYLVQVLFIYLDAAPNTPTLCSLHKNPTCSFCFYIPLLYDDKLEFLFRYYDNHWLMTSVLCKSLFCRLILHLLQKSIT